ncbi:MAG: class I SAM-dependent methyltransferase [Myxococcales bacterium]|nr:class I SAM-dependent methyltransferase [Myxococcales bacterium]
MARDQRLRHRLGDHAAQAGRDTGPAQWAGPMSEFDAFARDYRTVLDGSVGSAEYFAARKVAWLQRTLPATFSGRVLDFGCGVGLLAAAIDRAFPHCRLVGSDVSADSLAAVPADLRARHTFVSDPRAIGDGFEVVVLANVLHHVPPPQRDAVLADLAGRLVAGGRLAVFEHNPFNPATRLVVARCPFDEDAILLSPREAVRRLRAAGLCRLATAYLAFLPPALGRWAGIDRALGWCPAGAQYVASGVRP